MVLFYVYDGEKELNFDFHNSPKRYVDVETGEHINLYSENIKENYKEAVSEYFKELN